MAALGQRRRARLAIPRVNRPRVGPAHRIGRAGLAQSVVAAKSPATTSAQPSNTVPSTQSAPADPLAATSQSTTAAAPPISPFTVPAWSPKNPGEADPRDATYWAQLAKLKFDDEQRDRELGEAQSRSDLDYGDATRTALRNRMSQQRSLGESAMQSNLGASGWLNRNEAEQTAAYTEERQHATLTKEQEDHARAAARAALAQGFTIDAAALLAEAAGRFAGGAESQAENGELESSPGGGGGKGGGKGSGGGGKFAFYPTPGSLPMNQKKKKKSAKQALANNVVAGGGKKKGKK